MRKKFCLVLLFLILSISTAMAGLSSGYYNSGHGTVVAAVNIKDSGVYNLFVSIDFLRRSQNQKLFRPDDYGYLIDRLTTKWKTLAINKILESNELSIQDLVSLKDAIEVDVKKLVDQEKKKLFPEKDVEVIFSISGFFLLEPKNN